MNEIQRLILDIKPVSWNTLARKSYWTYKRVFDELKEVTFQAVREQKIRKYTCSIELYVNAGWKEKRRHDIDNIVLKPILDQLVEMEIIEDDSSKFIRHIHITGNNEQSQDSLVLEFRPYA